ncbi:MAG: DNA mismatch repair protein MutS [Alistipes sp.]
MRWRAYSSYIKALFMRNPLPATLVLPFNFEQISRYFHHRAAVEQPYQTIDEATAMDLDLDEVFEQIDRTTSKIGQQWLYAKIRTPKGEPDAVAFDRRVQLFEQDGDLADRCVKYLLPLADEDAYDMQRLIVDIPLEISNIRTIYALTAATVLSLAAALFYPPFLLLFMALFSVNTFLHYRNKINITYYLSAVTQLLRCIRTAQNLAAEPAVATDCELGWLPKMTELRRKSWIISRQSDGGNELAALFWMAIELIKISFNIEILLFHRFTRCLATERDTIEQMYRFVGETDAAIAVMHLRREQQTCRPNFTSRKFLDVQAITHPLIDNCVANSLTLDGTSLLLTGSNMSGKTSFIRTLCINALLAETIYTCFAKSYTAPYLKIYSSIRIADDLLQGSSYYLEEVLTIKKFLAATADTTPCLFALDELFKGTNTTERIAAGKAVLSHLNRKNHLVCVSTHDMELTELLQNDGYELYHFQEQVADQRLQFDFQLHPGRQTTKNAIKILELYDFPADLVDEAYHVQQKLA